MKCQCIMLLNLNSRGSGIQTDLCPFIKVRKSMCPLLPWPSIWIHSEMSDIGRVTCAPPSLLKLWEGHVLPSPFPLLTHSEMFHRLGHLCLLLKKLGGARVLSFRRSSLVEMPDTSRFAHFTHLINWLINASREGSRRPGALGGVKGAPGRVYR